MSILLGFLMTPVSFISDGVQQFQAKSLLLQIWKPIFLVKKYLNLDQVDRDFYSSRQDYTHAQQEELTEERDLCPSSQEVS